MRDGPLHARVCTAAPAPGTANASNSTASRAFAVSPTGEPHRRAGGCPEGSLSTLPATRSMPRGTGSPPTRSATPCRSNPVGNAVDATGGELGQRDRRPDRRRLRGRWHRLRRLRRAARRRHHKQPGSGCDRHRRGRRCPALRRAAADDPTTLTGQPLVRAADGGVLDGNGVHIPGAAVNGSGVVTLPATRSRSRRRQPGLCLRRR